MKLFVLCVAIAVVGVSCAPPELPQRPRPWWNHSTLFQNLITKSSSRIVGGFPVSIEDVPYQVSLRNWAGSHMCGGSIISSRWILTAAHCASASSSPMYTIMAGSTNRKEGTVFKLERIIPHPLYNGNTIDYDFSLIELKQDIEFDDTRSAIALPMQDEPLKEGALCRVSGWGDTKNWSESTTLLRATDVPSVDQDRCSTAYGGFGGITPRMLCAGYWEGGKDACQGDSGGPLASGGKLVGVVSWGYGCAMEGYPGVYSRVAAVRDWIQQETGL
ncbi:trypsin 3A1-like [Armigeres subalbatus]|uniref:trypsin 3A1-like n=1 Tax=Armigeres subalbatus TaxID=124917 RepID=UPI002ED57333